MTLLLLMITGISLLGALSAGSLLLKSQQAERARVAARVALLREAAGDEAAVLPQAADTVQEAVATHDEMFVRRESASPLPARAAAAVVCALGAALIGLALLPTRPETAPRAAAAPGPLELVSLAHTPETSTLTISGVARNPDGRMPLGAVMVVASALDAAGHEIARGQADLERRLLDSGTESPFVVKIAVGGAVSRFRVGFRAADGTPIPHVDRRPHNISAGEQRVTRGDPWVQ